MKLNNRDPYGRKLYKVKIENKYCILEDEEDRKKEEKRQRNQQTKVLDGIETFRCTILTQFLVSECAANEIFAFVEKNFEFEVLGEQANIGLKCYSITISRNRQLHTVILEQPCKIGRRGEYQRLEKQKKDAATRKWVDIHYPAKTRWKREREKVDIESDGDDD